MSSRKRKAPGQLTISELFRKKVDQGKTEATVEVEERSDVECVAADGNDNPETPVVSVEDAESEGEPAETATEPAQCQPVVQPDVNDIGDLYNLQNYSKWTTLPLSLSREKKTIFLKHYFVPGSKYPFPNHTAGGDRTRHFRCQ